MKMNHLRRRGQVGLADRARHLRASRNDVTNRCEQRPILCARANGYSGRARESRGLQAIPACSTVRGRANAEMINDAATQLGRSQMVDAVRWRIRYLLASNRKIATPAQPILSDGDYSVL